MKNFTTFALILLFNFISAQIPTGYYSTATGTGFTLKTQLYNKIKNHTDQGYSGLWTTYATSDRDKEYENDNSIIDVYSEKPTAADPYTYIYGTSQCGTYSAEGGCYNREHMIPQSVFNSAAPMVSDAHFIPPTDGKVNGVRSNYPHGLVATATFISLNGGKLGNSAVSDYTGTVFEPINEFKGDIARMYFYFATRYENTVGNYIYPMFNRTSTQVFSNAFLAMLLNWHNNDPVSSREITRNNAIYARQGNRNPYIDNPSFVNSIWGGGTTTPVADTTAPTTPTLLTFSAVSTSSVTLNWQISTDNVAVQSYDVFVNNVLKNNVLSNSIVVTGLNAATTYSFFVKAKDAAGNSSVASLSVNATTSALAAPAIVELFFTEYIEGSSNNKVLEITNKTANAITLTPYVIKKQTNGAGVWSSGLPLNGTLASNGKFVIINSALATSCYSSALANVSTAAAEMSFNGNDAIGLFKNGILIDIIGTFNGGIANFSIDETLRRKAAVIAPTTTFNKSGQWDIFPLDTCSGINNRQSQQVQIITAKAPVFTIFPNPSNGEFIIEIEIVQIALVQIFSIQGQKVVEQEIRDKQLIVNLQPGIYIVKIINNDGFETKKLVVN